MKNAVACLLFGMLVTTAACGPSEAAVEEEIAAARSCEATTDCVNLGSTCPFGCSIVVNKAEASRIQELMDSYTGTRCDYECSGISGITCKDKLCDVIPLE